MTSYNVFYLLYIFVISIIQLVIFNSLFDNKKFKNVKGTFWNKAKYSIFVILIFMLPLLYPKIHIDEWFDIAKLTIFLGIFCELICSDNSKKIFGYKSILLLISFYSILFVPDNINTAILVAIVVICMDTGMSIFGRFVVSRIPCERCKFRYPDCISKNKTGLSAILSFIVCLLIFSQFFEVNLIVTICFATFLGDAVFSHYKRVNNVDDFSNLLGPIGGFSDRFDGWVFSFFFISIFGIEIAAL
jgi:CDP-diglyceride synthetase